MINRLLDLRFTIGLFFLLVGLMLLGYSFFGARVTTTGSSVNRLSGILFSLFGVLMICLRFIAHRPPHPPPPAGK